MNIEKEALKLARSSPFSLDACKAILERVESPELAATVIELATMSHKSPFDIIDAMEGVEPEKGTNPAHRSAITRAIFYLLRDYENATGESVKSIEIRRNDSAKSVPGRMKCTGITLKTEMI